jgi:4-diphosphocytidyl-2-C-methyl-D-erythritol kinase
MRLCTLAPGKVNLCLFLGGTRADGRHELVTVFESVSLADRLELTVLEPTVLEPTVPELTVLDGRTPDEVVCPGVEDPNLAAEALAGLRARGWDAPPVRIEIEKRVPVAAGMGGGSADAAAALRLAKALRAPPAELGELAIALGADVPSQLAPGLSLGTGAGEIVEAVAPLAAHALVIVPLPFTLATPAVYREADRLGLPRDPAALRERFVALGGSLRASGRLGADLLVNDLEPASRSLCPAIDEALAALRAAGAEAVFVCGSGPTCAGLWWGDDALANAGAAGDTLSDRYPGAVAVTPVGADAGAVTAGDRAR